MKQFLLPDPPGRDGLVRISGEGFHYLAHVRRLRAGDRFNARLPDRGDSPGPGALFTLEVRSLEGGLLSAAVIGGVLDSVSSLPPILLFQALPKGSKMDLIVRQAAEGALSEVVPFTAERSEARGKKEDGGERSLRWRRIIREALQQSGSSIATSLHPLLDEDGLFAYWEELKAAHPLALGVLLHQEPVKSGECGEGPLADSGFHRYLSTIPEILALAVGPEGGFSPAEVSRFMAAGFKALTIGHTVLRTETAALYGAAAARIILLERGSWIQKPR
ncbi:MAG: 16S rRNA (uracil(1498)-N(3))-methyltransferase [Treponema sp.]|jgi:16S rRNA (uracil1498-N3)-methyltransferase|nr:16S rRNA (uracil(1498)-N(3))-methyltransferase [Treponema sp.]